MQIMVQTIFLKLHLKKSNAQNRIYIFTGFGNS